jgi:hypothetical protein
MDFQLVSIVVVKCLILDDKLKSIISRVCLLSECSVIISDARQTKSHTTVCTSVGDTN